MKTPTSSIIRPETVATKLAALKNLQCPKFFAAVAACPRLIELMWFIQWRSLQPGGLVTFATEFLASFGARVGTGAMHRIGKTGEAYTAQERQEVIDSIPEWDHEFDGLFEQSYGASRNSNAISLLEEFNTEMRGDKLHSNFLRGSRAQPNLAFVNKKNHPYFYGFCDSFTLAVLPSLLEEFCTKPDACLPDSWYFQGLQGALIEMLDRHAAKALEGIAMTVVTDIVFDTMDFAWDLKTMAEINGDARFGKTESLKAWCNGRPGRARLVKTPCDNCDRSLLEALAEAMGIEVPLKMTYRELKTKVEFVLKHAGLMFVFDEGAWLLPQRYTAKTVPMRLNYVRSQILENGCPVVLVKTPQFFDDAAYTFEKTTGFNMAQFRGRIMRTVDLPKELPEEDLFAIVDIWLPDAPRSYKKRIVGCALSGESYLFAVEKIVKNARSVAKKNGHDQIDAADLDKGIALAGFVVPPPIASPAPAPLVVTLPVPARHVKPPVLPAIAL